MFSLLAVNLVAQSDRACISGTVTNTKVAIVPNANIKKFFGAATQPHVSRRQSLGLAFIRCSNRGHPFVSSESGKEILRHGVLRK